MKSSTITADGSSSEIDTGCWLFLDIIHFECDPARRAAAYGVCFPR